MVKTINQKMDELENSLKFEREILSEKVEKLKNLESEYLDEDDYHKYKKIYEESLEEQTMRIKKLEKQFESISKIRFVEDEIKRQNDYKERISENINDLEMTLNDKKRHLEYRQYLLKEKQKEILQLENDITACENEINDVKKRVTEQEILLNELFDKISSLEKDLKLAYVIAKED